MRNKVFLFPALFLCTLAWKQATPQASRGPHSGEFYINLPWYYDINTDLHHAISTYTNNNGRNLKILFTSIENSGEMQVGTILADATPNVLYNRDSDGLHRSFDNGQTWEFVEAQTGEYPAGYATGNVNNELFKHASGGIISKSTDNGNNWVQMQTDIPGSLDIGNQVGELYTIFGNVSGNSITELTINHSLNDGVDFISIEADTNIVGYKVSGYGPKFSRGTTIGELYLVTWWLGPKYRIYRSTDHGHSFTLQYEQPENAYMWDEMFAFTAGRGECEFYAFKLKTYVDGYYFRLHVYHSNDCAQIFTEYVHELTPDYDGNPDQIIYTIAANASPLEGGTVEGGGKYHEGYAVTLNALPNEGYKFTGWTEGDHVVSEEPTLSFTAESTRTLVAQFQLINNITSPSSYGITLYPNPITGNTITFELGEAPVEQVTIYNAKGVAVDWIRINEPANTYTHRHTLPAGFYVFTAVDRNGRRYNGKFVVQ